MENVFVTGLTGIVGSGFTFYIKKFNLNKRFNFFALCRKESNIQNIKDICNVIYGSSWDSTFLNDFFQKQKIDIIIHISNKTQIEQFSNFAIKYKIKKYIAISSTYACSLKNKNNFMKQLEERSIKNLNVNNIDYIFIRPTSIFGERKDGRKDKNISIYSNYVKKLKIFPLFNKGKASVQPVWGKDVGQALYISLLNFNTLKNKCLICSGDKQRTFKELILILSGLENKKIKFIYLPTFIGYTFFYGLSYLTFFKKDYREKISRLVEDKAFDSSIELAKLGYKATDLIDALKEYVI